MSFIDEELRLRRLREFGAASDRGQPLRSALEQTQQQIRVLEEIRTIPGNSYATITTQGAASETSSSARSGIAKEDEKQEEQQFSLGGSSARAQMISSNSRSGSSVVKTTNQTMNIPRASSSTVPAQYPVRNDPSQRSPIPDGPRLRDPISLTRLAPSHDEELLDRHSANRNRQERSREVEDERRHQAWPSSTDTKSPERLNELLGRLELNELEQVQPHPRSRAINDRRSRSPDRPTRPIHSHDPHQVDISQRLAAQSTHLHVVHERLAQLETEQKQLQLSMRETHTMIMRVERNRMQIEALMARLVATPGPNEGPERRRREQGQSSAQTQAHQRANAANETAARQNAPELYRVSSPFLPLSSPQTQSPNLAVNNSSSSTPAHSLLQPLSRRDTNHADHTENHHDGNRVNQTRSPDVEGTYFGAANYGSRDHEFYEF